MLIRSIIAIQKMLYASESINTEFLLSMKKENHYPVDQLLDSLQKNELVSFFFFSCLYYFLSVFLDIDCQASFLIFHFRELEEFQSNYKFVSSGNRTRSSVVTVMSHVSYPIDYELVLAEQIFHFIAFLGINWAFDLFEKSLTQPEKKRPQEKSDDVSIISKTTETTENLNPNQKGIILDVIQEWNACYSIFRSCMQ